MTIWHGGVVCWVVMMTPSDQCRPVTNGPLTPSARGVSCTWICTCSCTCTCTCTYVLQHISLWSLWERRIGNASSVKIFQGDYTKCYIIADVLLLQYHHAKYSTVQYSTVLQNKCNQGWSGKWARHWCCPTAIVIRPIIWQLDIYTPQS